MSARTKARKRALDILYVADLRQIPIPQALATEAERAANEPAREASWLYAREIVDGVNDHRAEIDELIETYAHGWTLARMPLVDRAIVRIGAWELLYNPEVPTGVAISEAVEAATVLSTEDSSGFINGLLAKIAQLADDAGADAGQDAAGDGPAE
jgi:N utilization substance protein B